MAEYTHSRPLRLFEICAGYGSQALALERLKRDYPDFGFELAGWCECDPESSKPIDEQPAVIAHNALHPDGIGKNWGDLTKIDWEQVPDFDLLTASTPCQSISSAGLQHGFVKDSGTRSSIIWNVHDCVRVKRPRYILMENVSAILSDKFFPLLHLWMVELERMGYTNFMPTPFTLQDGSTTRNGCLNSKHYGCPQNRERWFMVSILDCKGAYYFPKPFKLEKRLKDVLEKSVHESCYLSQERVDGLVLSTEKEKDAGKGFEFAPKTVDSDCANTISTNAGGRKTDNFVIVPCIAAMRGRSDGEWYGSEHQQRLEIGGSDTSNSLTSVAKDNLLIEPCVSCIGNIYDNDANPQAGRIYDTDGISHTLDTCCGGNREPKILEPVVIEDFYQDRPIRVYEGEAPTIRSDRAGLKVAEPIVTNEKWVDIDGYEGLYQISNFGRVKSLERIVKKADYLCPIHERILVNKKDKDGYYIICLSKENVITTFKVHRLVAQAFIPNPQNLPEVNHIDRNRQNNNVNNLEWCTRSYNSTHSSGRVVVQGTMDGQVVNIFPSTAEASRSVKCTPDYRTDIVACCKGKTKSAFGYKWWYATDKILLGWSRSSNGKEVSYHKVDIANCVTAGKRDNTQNYVLEQVIEEVQKAFPNRGILMYKGNPYFVRKLSTRELYRLMDLSETDIDTLMATDISKTNHAKLAGNSIVVSVLYHIFRTMFIDTVPIYGTQTTLF